MTDEINEQIKCTTSGSFIAVFLWSFEMMAEKFRNCSIIWTFLHLYAHKTAQLNINGLMFTETLFHRAHSKSYRLNASVVSQYITICKLLFVCNFHSFFFLFLLIQSRQNELGIIGESTSKFKINCLKSNCWRFKEADIQRIFLSLLSVLALHEAFLYSILVIIT